MTNKYYGYIIYGTKEDMVITFSRHTAIKYIQNEIMESLCLKEMVKECMTDEGYTDYTDYSDEEIRDFIQDMLLYDSYYFDNIYYVKVPVIED